MEREPEDKPDGLDLAKSRLKKGGRAFWNDLTSKAFWRDALWSKHFGGGAGATAASLAGGSAVRAASRSARFLVKTGGSGLAHIADAASAAFARESAPHPGLEAEYPDAAARFEALARDYGKSEADFVAILKATRLRVYGFAVFASVAVAASAGAASTSLAGALVGAAGTSLALVLMVRSAYWNAQVRNRTLFDFSAFVRSPRLWWPETEMAVAPPRPAKKASRKRRG